MPVSLRSPRRHSQAITVRIKTTTTKTQLKSCQHVLFQKKNPANESAFSHSLDCFCKKKNKKNPLKLKLRYHWYLNSSYIELCSSTERGIG
jgi:hypothetical protein